MKNTAAVPAREVIKTALAALFVVLLVCGVLFAAECSYCLYTEKEKYPTPDGIYLIELRSTTPHFMAETCDIKITAKNNRIFFSDSAVSRRYSTVYEWSVEWKDEDTAVIRMEGIEDTVLTAEFAEGAYPVFSEQTA